MVGTTEASGHAASYHVLLAQHVALAGFANAAGQTAGQPFDFIKIKLQMQGRSANPVKKYNGVYGGLKTIYHEKGVVGLFGVWRISFAREWWYSGLRMGLYEPVKHAFGGTDRHATDLSVKIASGAVSGTIASLLSNPLDLVKVRYMAVEGDPYAALGPPVKFLVNMARKGGIRALYQGLAPNCMRAASITASQVPAYDHTKHHLLNHGYMEEGLSVHFTSSFVASWVAIFATNPVDVLKTRSMAATASVRIIDITRDVLKNEGPLAFYKGSLSAWLRLGPHTIVTFISLEQLRKVANLQPL